MIGTFVTINVSIILVASFFILLLSAIVNGDDEETVVAAFGSIFGLTTFISVISLFAVIKLSIKLRHSDIQSLRILGATTNQIKLMVFIENIILFIFGFALAVSCSTFVAKFLSNYLVNNSLIPNSFKINNLFWIKLMGGAAIFVAIIIATWFSLSEIKKISIFEAKDPFKKGSKVSNAIKITMGILFVIGAIFLMNLNSVFSQPEGVGIITGAIGCYIFGFAYLGKPIIIGIMKLIKLCSKKTFVSSMTWSMMIKNISRIIFPITVMSLILVFISFTTNINEIIAMKYKVDNSNKTVQILLAIIFGIYGIIIVSNSMQSYLFDKKEVINLC